MTFGRIGLILLGVAGLLGRSASAEDSGYRQPPEPIASILDAQPTPYVSLSPDRSRLVLVERSALPTIAEVSAPELGLAGSRINPQTNGPSRTTSYRGYRLRALEGGEEVAVQGLPDDARLGYPSWSPDSETMAFLVTDASGIAIWVADATTGQARALTDPRINAAGGTTFTWMPDSQKILCAMIPDGRGEAPTAPTVPDAPIIQESAGRAAPNRTYQNLLKSPADEALFEHYFEDQLVLVPLEGGPSMIGEPGLHGSVSPSPDGTLLLVETIHRPFSYLVPSSRFPTTIAVWDLDGQVVHTLVDRSLQEEVPIAFDSTITGPRSVRWRADQPATLVWTEALDGGDPSQEAEYRDVIKMLAAPFDAQPTDLIKAEYRLGGVLWSDDDLALVSERWWQTRRTRTWAIAPGNPESEPRILFDRSSEDRYDDPGSFLTEIGPLGRPVLLRSEDGGSAYLAGAGASSEGDQPFLDRYDLTTGQTTRLFRSEPPSYETIVDVLDAEAQRIITRRESVEDPPNYLLRNLEAGAQTRLTDFDDPAPELAGLAPELITYERSDGVTLSAKLYLPRDYDPAQGPIPFVLWAYPREFKSAAAASQVSGSPHRFVRPGGISHLFLLTQGYGILDGPAMPIIGDGGEEPNDTYVEQLVASAQAAVDAIVARGVADPDRIAIGGHSYGAFMTANLLAHSDLFAAGIARSGAYNRTLTPFGFQAEQRPFWKARDIYMQMSPFTYANQINEPMLMIHGTADNNSGTFPVQSERMYAAVKGNGGIARLVMLPAESHGYRARESVGHTHWEMVRWLDRHLKSETTSPDDPDTITISGSEDDED